MRIGGLATGMDIDQLVNKLMTAERVPLDRMNQDKTTLTWKRDAFRDINKTLLELDNVMLDMKLSNTYHSKSVHSSQESAIKAIASANSANGTYQIKVTKLASSAINISTEEIDPNQVLKPGTIEFFTYDDAGEKKNHEIKINENDSIEDVLKKITDGDNNVRAFYDSQTNNVMMEATRTGKYSPNGEPEINFTEDSFFAKSLKMDPKKEKNGTNAEFEYNGIQMESKTNSYELNGVTFQFNDVSKGNTNITIENDAESPFESIMEFIDKYNEVIEKLNASQREERFRDFKPLTVEQKEEMSEDQIKKWEEKAKSGILKGESVIKDGMFSMRRSWYTNVDTGGAFSSLTEIGITTSSNYMDGGKLIIKNEDDLKNALRDNPNDVMKLFSNNAEGTSRGIVNRLEDVLEETMNKVKKRAGSGTSTLETYTLGKRMKDLNQRITAFEDRLVQVETRYWNQFTAMEKAIQRMNMQSAQLMSQFGANG
ncbi:flagellar hook-associated protein 2 [Virgibacillus alimentarius]|uniref:Flagellar hook-associated protein 2 n=1 Tax=Virgibacillus alimentarius TaxID=698769 RepID=A0ABS4S5N5_9BACI|nr:MULTISPECIES: flagellar hook-associated protein 2 [Virgibacillus]MBP2256795.1 flagellar hook-associated protein 2 [Virgibacillus alimentarius]HLR65664.1 flagellar hook-associated protein 2 [Virgibacillus sp.]